MHVLQMKNAGFQQFLCASFCIPLQNIYILLYIFIECVTSVDLDQIVYQWHMIRIYNGHVLVRNYLMNLNGKLVYQTASWSGSTLVAQVVKHVYMEYRVKRSNLLSSVLKPNFWTISTSYTISFIIENIWASQWTNLSSVLSWFLQEIKFLFSNKLKVIHC